jgi:RNA polymerase sigma-70 factor (ECF subfamily)
MVKVWRHAKSFDDHKGSARTWLFTIARRVLIDHQRRKVEVDAPAAQAAPLEDTADAAPLASEALGAHQDHERLEKMLAQLPQEQSSVISRMYLSGRTLREIAEEDGIALGTAKTRARLGMEHLRRIAQNTGLFS